MGRACVGVLAALLACACGEPTPPPAPEPWAGRSAAEWPAMTLANRIRVGPQLLDARGGAFLLDTGQDTLAVAAKHLLLAFRSERLRTVDFAGVSWQWTMYRRDAPADSVLMLRLINADPGEELVRSHVVHRDWLVFELAGRAPAIQPLRPGPAPRSGQTVHVVGWDAAGQQVVHTGEVVQLLEGKYLVDLGEADVGAWSGAPVVDDGGHLVGLHTGTVSGLSWVNSTRYLDQILAARHPRR